MAAQQGQLGTTRTRKVLSVPPQTWSAALPPERLFIVVSGLLAAASAVSVAVLTGTNTPSRTNIVDTPPQRRQPRPETEPPGNLSQGNGQKRQSSDNLAKLRSTALGKGEDVRPAISSVKLTKPSTILAPGDTDASLAVRTTKGD